jgi:hypothetical protein
MKWQRKESYGSIRCLTKIVGDGGEATSLVNAVLEFLAQHAVRVFWDNLSWQKEMIGDAKKCQLKAGFEQSWQTIIMKRRRETGLRM